VLHEALIHRTSREPETHILRVAANAFGIVDRCALKIIEQFANGASNPKSADILGLKLEGGREIFHRPRVFIRRPVGHGALDI
jgi:hypothetical protein